jgi:hypothetical protein
LFLRQLFFFLQLRFFRLSKLISFNPPRLFTEQISDSSATRQDQALRVLKKKSSSHFFIGASGGFVGERIFFPKVLP